MDKDAPASAVQKEQKDGFSQLAEKMEQVRTQMINMERKYDELYRTVKEKESRSSSSQNKEELEVKSGRESIVETTESARASKAAEPEKNSTKTDKSPEETASAKSNLDAEIEKMEDNPFM